MASISREANGRRTIQFVGADSKRRSIRLGKISQRMAEAIKTKVEHLAAAAASGGPLDSETARWTAEVGDDLADKLSKAGLIPERERATLAGFLQEYIESRVDAKPASKVVWRHVKRNLADFLGADRNVRKVTVADAEAFRLYLITDQKLADTTVAKRLQFTRQFFATMQRRKLIPENPFAHVKHKAGDPAERQRFIPGEHTEKLIEAAPDWVWRTIIALARYGGLRCPSEVLSLRWVDVDWERARMTVQSPKTEHNPGGASRVIPIFPELRPWLDEAWEMAEKGQVYVVPKYQEASRGPDGWVNCNLRTQFERIVKRAGLEPWPRLFHNLRASRETELAAVHPVHVVAEWLGNTPKIAAKHYLQVTEADFHKAVQYPVHVTSEVVQNPVQPMSADVCQETTKPQGSLGVRLTLANCGDYRQFTLAEGTGLEPATPGKGHHISSVAASHSLTLRLNRPVAHR